MPSSRTRSRSAATRAVPGATPVLQRDAAGGGDGEAVLEVLVGVVEDDEGPAAHRREPCVDAAA